jgi:hypothetical protein
MFPEDKGEGATMGDEVKAEIGDKALVPKELPACDEAGSGLRTCERVGESLEGTRQ